MAEQWNDDRDFLRDSFWIFHAWKMFVPHGLACVIDDLDFFADVDRDEPNYMLAV